MKGVGLPSLIPLVLVAAASPAWGGPPRGTARDVAKVLARAGALSPCEALLLLDRERYARRYPRGLRARLRKATRELTADGEVSLVGCRLDEKVRKLMAEGRAGKPQEVRLRMRFTVGWGCPCPPLVHEEVFDVEGRVDETMFVYPRFAPGVPDATDIAGPGTVVVTGHYTGRRIDRFEYAKLDRRKYRRSDRLEYYSQKHPELRVTKWCYVKPKKRVPPELRKQVREAHRRFRCRK